jgi:hypothetical protein
MYLTLSEIQILSGLGSYIIQLGFQPIIRITNFYFITNVKS